MNREQAVFVSNQEAEAQQVRAFLEAEGIPSGIRSESLWVAMGLPLGQLGEFKVVVAPEDEERSRELLTSVESGAFELGSDAGVDPA